MRMRRRLLDGGNQALLYTFLALLVSRQTLADSLLSILLPCLLFHLVGWFADIVSRLNVGRGLIAISVPLYNERDR